MEGVQGGCSGGIAIEPAFGVNRQDGSARMLFRGHANSEWTLQTTLERAGHRTIPLQRYHNMIVSARRYIGNLLPDNVDFDERPGLRADETYVPFPNYEYAAFLRHHGFPSPLLDWTESPFVAAFFAFRNVAPEVSSVRIFGYRSHVGQGREHIGGEANLDVLGPFAKVHERHLAQQCNYTWCSRENGSEVIICPHEEGFSHADDRFTGQDQLVEWDIDVSERELVLGDLFQMNITPFSLFRNLDGAVETARLRIIGGSDS